jgi:hypothetical protein
LIDELIEIEDLDIFNLERCLKGLFFTNQNLIQEDKLRVVVSSYRFFKPLDYLKTIVGVYLWSFDDV